MATVPGGGAGLERGPVKDGDPIAAAGLSGLAARIFGPPFDLDLDAPFVA